MTVRIWGEQLLHVMSFEDPLDHRLAWTACGIRFAWGDVSKVYGPSGRCRICGLNS